MLVEMNKILDLIDKKLSSIGVEEVLINRGLGRVLAEHIFALHDLPESPGAKTDGYAFRLPAGGGFRREMKIIGQSLPGSECKITVSGDHAVKVYSGSDLPRNCTAIVAVKDAVEKDSVVIISSPILAGDNIRIPGAIVKKGEILIPGGRLIRSGDIGLLALSGLEHIKIFRPPKIGLINVGSELKEIYEPLLPGETRNAGQYLLKAKLEKIGYNPVFLATVFDDFDEMKKVFNRALQKCDVVITTGGASLSKNDLTKSVWEALGIDFVLDGLEMSPGRNTGIGVGKNKRFIFTLAGNPVSAAIMFDIIVVPGLMKIIGREPRHPAPREAILECDLQKAQPPVKILPGLLSSEGRINYVKPAEADIAGSMAGLAAANCYILLKMRDDFNKTNDLVDVIDGRDI